jgi:hypothetical protein
MFVFQVTDTKSKCRTVKTRDQVQRTREYKKKNPGRSNCFFSKTSSLAPGHTQFLING